MKIALVSPWSVSARSVGGTERFIVDLAESLVKRDHDVDVLMFSGVSYVANNVNYISLDLLGKAVSVDEYKLRNELGDFSVLSTYAKLASRIESMVDSSKYDVMQINTQLLLLAWPNARKIFTVHTNPFEYKQAWGDCSYAKMVEITQGVATSDNVTFTAPSRHYAELFSDAIQANVTFIPHAIDVSRVISHTTKAELALRYDLDVSKLHILLPSRLEPVQKQPDLLFNALQYLPEEWLNKIEILSSGVDAQYRGYQHKFTKQANDLGCSVFFGRFDYMSDAYQLADVVVLPSQSESFGYSALESLSLGIPTILNDIPTFHEIADGHPSARFFRGDSMELSNILQSIVESGVVRMKADSDWADRYSLQRWVKQYEELM